MNSSAPLPDSVYRFMRRHPILSFFLACLLLFALAAATAVVLVGVFAAIPVACGL